MDEREIADTLADCERRVQLPGKIDLRGARFWRAVAAAKRDPSLAERYGQRIAEIDRRAFLRGVLLSLPAPIGLTLLTLGTAAGIVLLVAGFYVPVQWRDWAILAGAAALLGSTHGLAHYFVGRFMGMRFTHWFSRPPLPQPGFKVDYASYLRVPAASRAWMHASGAIVSKLVPFAVVPVALLAGAQAWTLWILLGFGVLQLITDATYSVRASDWKKFRREMRLARAR